MRRPRRVATRFGATIALGLLAACGTSPGGSGGDGGGAPALRSLSGDVACYPYASSATVQAFAVLNGVPGS